MHDHSKLLATEPVHLLLATQHPKRELEVSVHLVSLHQGLVLHTQASKLIKNSLKQQGHKFLYILRKV